MAHRINSKEERAEILVLLTKQLVDTECVDLEILRQVDRLCRRTWSDIHRGWVSWSYYLDGILGGQEYSDWARQNCDRLEPDK